MVAADQIDIVEKSKTDVVENSVEFRVAIAIRDQKRRSLQKVIRPKPS
mgnify:CR=1 FL=1